MALGGRGGGGRLTIAINDHQEQAKENSREVLFHHFLWIFFFFRLVGGELPMYLEIIGCFFNGDSGKMGQKNTTKGRKMVFLTPKLDSVMQLHPIWEGVRLEAKMSNEKKPGYLWYIGDYTTQLYIWGLL